MDKVIWFHLQHQIRVKPFSSSNHNSSENNIIVFYLVIILIVMIMIIIIILIIDQRRGPIAAEFAGPGPAAITLPSLFGSGFLIIIMV